MSTRQFGAALLRYAQRKTAKEVHFINLGAGVQSSVMLLMADRGELTPKPMAAIFADTQWEPPKIYEHLEWLKSEVSIPVHIVTAGNLRENALKGLSASGHRAKNGDGWISMPLFTNEFGIGRRTCTREYKILPIEKKVRRLCGVRYGKHFPKDLIAINWLGITTDEISRMKVARAHWQRLHYPFIKLGMSRTDCIEWFDKHYPGRQLNKSACIGCPYHGKKEWLDIKSDEQTWKDAVEFDEKIRNVGDTSQFLHRSCQPLNEVDLGSMKETHWSAMEQECEGMCGV